MEENVGSTVETQANRVGPYEAAPTGAASYVSTLFAMALYGAPRREWLNLHVRLVNPFPHIDSF